MRTGGPHRNARARDRGGERLHQHRLRPRDRAGGVDLRQIRHIKVGLVSAASLATTSKRRTSHRTTAIARVLPELLKIERYERQAASRRDRAVRDLVNGERRLVPLNLAGQEAPLQTQPSFGRTNPNS